MRTRPLLRILTLLAAIGVGILEVASFPQADPLAGQWEGQILDPVRPYKVVVTFSAGANGASRGGTIDVLGRNGVPLSDVTVELPRVRFSVAVPQGTLAFDGELKGSEIAGKLPWRGGQVLDFLLVRLPEQKAPVNRAEAWQQDLDSALRLTVYDRSFFPAAREEFKKQIAALRTRAGQLNDQQLFLGLARAVALAGNGHTGVAPARPQRRYPVRLYWFRDGLFVVRAAPEQRELVGCRVTAIGNASTEDALKRVSEMIGGNEQVKRYRSQNILVSAETLFGLGIVADTERAQYSFQCKAVELKRTLTSAEPPDRADAWRNLSPNSAIGTGDWITAIPRSGNLPLYLRRPQDFYWFELLKDSGVLYFQFNQSLNAPQGENVAAFGEKLLAALNEPAVKALVVDMRFNTGGNLMISRRLIERLRSSEKLKGPNKLFVITSGTTFSAAIFHAAQLRENPDAVFVGEPVGDFLEFWAEGDSLRLPNSGITLRYSNGYHSYSTADPPQWKPYYMDLSIQSLGPDVKASPTFAEFAAGRDLAMEAILARVR